MQYKTGKIYYGYLHPAADVGKFLLVGRKKCEDPCKAKRIAKCKGKAIGIGDCPSEPFCGYHYAGKIKDGYEIVLRTFKSEEDLRQDGEI
jgi:hypothetical protein